MLSVTTHTAPVEQHSGADDCWWQSRFTLTMLVILAAVPFLMPQWPPLTDLLGHMGRYRIQLDLEASPELQAFYTFDWALVGNLGVDLLVQAFAPVVGLEASVKIIVALIPMLTVAGFLLVAHEVHGRVPPTAFFTLPLAYSYPLHFGFVNYCLSVALAFLGAALWIRLGSRRRERLRTVIFIPIGLLVWLSHAFGWGILGLLAFSCEAARHRDTGSTWASAIIKSGLACLPLAPPLLLMVAWRSGQGQVFTGDWLNLKAKVQWFLSVFRDRWQVFDVASFAAIVMVAYYAIRSRSIEASRGLLIAAGLLGIVFLLLPRVLFGSAYADMRLAPYISATLLLAFRCKEGDRNRSAKILALLGLMFVIVRTAGVTTSFWLYDRDLRREAGALPHIPVGARLVSFIGVDCEFDWSESRLTHLPALALVRRSAFSNEQWTIPGAQLIGIKHHRGEPFTRDPSQLITQRRCPHEPWFTANEAISAVQSRDFEYLWLIAPPPYDPRLTSKMTPVWRSGSSVLYRIPKS